MFGLVLPRLDGQGPVCAQSRGDRSGVHIFWQLALVGKGVHYGPVSGQLSGEKGQEGLRLVVSPHHLQAYTAGKERIAIVH